MVRDPKADPSTYLTASDEQLRRMGASDKEITAIRRAAADEAKAAAKAARAEQAEQAA